MKLVALLLAALCLPAFGQLANENPCGTSNTGGSNTAPAPAPTVVLYNDASTANCAPAPFGPGTVPTIRANAAGITAWNYCPVATGGWSLQFVAGTWASVSGFNYLADTASIAASTDPLAQLNSILALRMTTPLSDPTLAPVWCPYASEMLAGAPKPTSVVVAPPVATGPRWVAASNGTSLTRPSFAVVNGVRSFSSKTTVAVGAPCSLDLKLVEGRNTYLQVAPGLVAICALVP